MHSLLPSNLKHVQSVLIPLPQLTTSLEFSLSASSKIASEGVANTFWRPLPSIWDMVAVIDLVANVAA